MPYSLPVKASQTYDIALNANEKATMFVKNELIDNLFSTLNISFHPRSTPYVSKDIVIKTIRE